MNNNYNTIKSQLLEYIAITYLSIVVFVKPIIKYFEWHHDGFRINISVVYAVLLFVAIIEIILKLHSRKLTIPKDLSHSLSICIILFLFFYQLLHYPYISSLPIYRIHDFFLFYFSESVIQAGLYLLSGFYVFNILQRKKINNLFTFFWLIFSVIVLVFTNYNTVFLTSSIEASAEHNNYLMMSDAYALLSYFVIVNNRNIFYRLGLILISLLCLFFLKSRASLYMFIVVNIICLILINKRFLWLLLITFIVSFLSLDWKDFLRMNSNNRMFRLATFGHDVSADIRTNILIKSLNEIKSNFLWGQFMGDVLIEKNTGTYIHNILSYLRQYGIIPFLILLIILFRNYAKLYYAIIHKQWSKPVEFLFLYGTHCLALSLFARSFLFSEIWLLFSAIPLLYRSFQS